LTTKQRVKLRTSLATAGLGADPTGSSYLRLLDSKEVTEEPPEWHAEPFNWRGLLYIVVGLSLLFIAIFLLVNLAIP